MPLDPLDRKHLQAATGYAELGMFLEADAELERIEPLSRSVPEVLALRIDIYRGLERWELMAQIAKRLCEFDPGELQWVVSYAFATRRSVSIDVAKTILLESVKTFPREAVILFNLACYECQLGQIESAKDYLQRVFSIDPGWRIAALEDEDLIAVWESI
jgi:tetratricopeptide (TPR) repeat protein